MTMPPAPLDVRSRISWADYAFAVGAVAVAAAARSALDPVFGNQYPFLTFFAAVTVVAWFGRTRPALVTLVLSAAAASYLFVSPRYTLAPAGPGELLGMWMYVAVAGVVVAMSHHMRVARTRVEDQHERLRVTLASIGDAVITTDTAGRVTNLNGVAELLTGWTTAEALGQPLDLVFHIVNETTRQPVENPATRALREGIIVGLANHTVLISRNGTEWHIDDSASPIRAATGEILGCVLVFRDISEQRARQEALAGSETRFRELADAMPQIVYASDASGKVVFVNRQWLDFTGQSDAQTADLGPLVHPDDLAAMVRAWDNARAAGTALQAEFRLRRADGEYRWFLTRSVPVRADDGRVVQWFGTSTDIHEQKETERRLAESEALYRAIGESIDFGVWVCDADGRNIYASESFLRMVGITQSQCSDFGWGDVLHPDDVDGTIAAWKECVRTQGTWDREHRFRGVDGQWHHVLARGVPRRDADGTVLGWAGINLDVTRFVQTKREVSRLAAETDRQRRLYETVLANTPDLAYVFDLSHRFTYANPALLTMWGRTWDEAIGKTCLQLGYEPWHAAMHGREIDQVVATKQPIRGEVSFDGTNGRRLYDYIFVPVIGADGEVEAVAGTTRDVTDRHKAEAEREVLVSQLRDQDRRKDEFLATLAHELRNPLAPIGYGLELIRMAGANGTIEQVRSMMERQLSQMTRLVDDLLDVSRVTSGKLQLRKEPVDLRAVIDAAVETSRPAIEQSGHHLKVTRSDEAIFVHGDPVRLAQIVSNLLTNSARYTGRGGHIQVRVTRDGPSAVVEVIDDGIGIPPAMLEAVFGMFSQVDRTLEKTTGGLGIGLSLVRGLVEMHGGSVEARSEGEGRGSTFVVRLPVVTPPNHAAVPVTAGLIPPVQTGLRRVLVVDDNVDSADALAQLLDLHGHDVRTAYDGEAGVDAARAFRPGVVLCDIGMPKMNGYNLARRIRGEEWGRDIVLVALTGWGQDHDRQTSADAGFDHHLVKPVEDEVLLDLIAGLPGSSSS